MNRIFEYKTHKRKWPDDDMADHDNYMKSMGKNGWELVAVLFVGDRVYYYWKCELL